MPELPEVERFRQILLPLVSKDKHLLVASAKENPPKVWLSVEDIATLNNACCCVDVVRKGKQICMILELVDDDDDDDQTKKQTKNTKQTREMRQCRRRRYLFLHMGMTGRIISPGIKTCWGHNESMKDDEVEQDAQAPFPPKYTYLVLQTGEYKVAFSDPRKFGKSELKEAPSPSSATNGDNDNAFCEGLMDDLAPDAWLCSTHEREHVVLPQLTQKRLGIKAIILDQKRACSGVGNWVADEVLYQCQIHPDQAYMTKEQASHMVDKLKEILGVAVQCLESNQPYPPDWLFHYRWTKKQASKDAQGRNISFLQSGGRTSAIVASQQKLCKSAGRKTSTQASSHSKGRGKNAKKATTSKPVAVSPEPEEKAPETVSSSLLSSEDHRKAVVIKKDSKRRGGRKHSSKDSEASARTVKQCGESSTSRPKKQKKVDKEGLASVGARRRSARLAA